MKNTGKSYIHVLIAGFLWGCIGLFSKTLGAAGFSSMQIVSIRVTIAAVSYALFLLFKSPDKLKIKLRDIYYFIGTGIVSLVFFSWCYFGAIEESSMAVAAVLLYTSPIFVMLMSAVLFKERITAFKLIALAAAFMGCILVTGLLSSNEGITVKAVLLGLGSGIGYAMYSIFGKYAMRKYSSETVTVYTFIMAAVAAVPMAIFEGGSGSLKVDAMTAISAIGLGFFCCVLPYVFYTKGLEKLEAGKAAVVATSEPVVAAIMGTVVFGEEMKIGQLLGIILVLGAVVLMNIGDMIKGMEKGKEEVS